MTESFLTSFSNIIPENSDNVFVYLYTFYGRVGILGKNQRKKGSIMLTTIDLYQALPVLETERLRLRPVRTEDATDIYAYTKDEETERADGSSERLISSKSRLSNIKQNSVMRCRATTGEKV